MDRVVRLLFVLLAVVPAAGVLAAVQATPRSSYSLPSYELGTAAKPIRLGGADLGVHRTSGGVAVERAAMDRTIARLAAIFRVPAAADTYALEAGRVVLKPGHGGAELDRAATRALLMSLVHGATTDLALPVRAVPPPAAPQHAVVVKLSEYHLDLYNRTHLVDHFPVGVGR